MNFNTEEISTQLMFCTVLLFMHTNEGTKTGTGHIYVRRTPKGDIPFIITNKHIVDGCISGEVYFTEAKDNKPIVGSRLKVSFDGPFALQHVFPDYDLAFIPLGPILKKCSEQGKNVFFRSISQEIFLTPDSADKLSAIEQITFIGYPRGIFDLKNNLPIIRQGITSTPIWNKYNDRNIFLIDASSFPGSSGSPVFIFNQGMYYAQGNNLIAGTRVLYCGVLTETITHKSNDGIEYLNLGVVVNAIAVKEKIELILKKIETK